jgi:hypothetical protein
VKLDVQINTHQCIKSNHIAELGQQIERNWGDKVWVCSIFQWLVEKNMNNERVIRYWLSKYKLDMKLYKVILTNPSTETKVALVKHLRVCSINDFEQMYQLQMRRVLGCVVGDEIRMDLLKDGYVDAKVKVLRNNGELKGGELESMNINGEARFCRIKLVKNKKK